MKKKIIKLSLQQKHEGDLLTAEEFNTIPEKINEIVDSLDDATTCAEPPSATIDIAQELGEAADKPISQKAVSAVIAEIEKKARDNAEAIASMSASGGVPIAQEIGDSATSVMSQKATKDALKRLEESAVSAELKEKVNALIKGGDTTLSEISQTDSEGVENLTPFKGYALRCFTNETDSVLEGKTITFKNTPTADTSIALVVLDNPTKGNTWNLASYEFRNLPANTSTLNIEGVFLKPNSILLAGAKTFALHNIGKPVAGGHHTFQYNIYNLKESSIGTQIRSNYGSDSDSVTVFVKKNNHAAYIDAKNIRTTTGESVEKMLRKLQEEAHPIENAEPVASSKVYDITQYGVVEGDIDDYATCVRNTIAIANLFLEVQSYGGGAVLIPAGTFSIIPGIIKLQENVSIVGVSKELSVLKCQPSAIGIGAVFGYDGAISKERALKHCVFKDFAIDMTYYVLPKNMPWGVNQKGIFYQYLEHCSFERLRMIGSPATALGVDYLMDCFIVNCEFIDCGKYFRKKKGEEEAYVNHYGNYGCAGIGIGTGGYDDENLIISGNICHGCGQFGIFIENQVRLSNSRETPPDGRGIIISNNITRNGLNCGIGVRDGRNVIVTGNVTYSNYGAGIYCDFSLGDVSINHNIVLGNGKSKEELDTLGYDTVSNQGGILFTKTFEGGENVVISDNEISKNTGGGITINGSHQHVLLFIDNNRISKQHSDWGLKIDGNVDKLSIRNNYIEDKFILKGNLQTVVANNNVVFGDKEISAVFNGNDNFNEFNR